MSDKERFDEMMGRAFPAGFDDAFPEEYYLKGFVREELWELGARARAHAALSANPHWQRVYYDLDHALNVIDAFMARVEAQGHAPIEDLLRDDLDDEEEV